MFAISEGQRKAHYEECESEKKRNAEKIRQLKKEVKDLRIKLSQPPKVSCNQIVSFLLKIKKSILMFFFLSVWWKCLEKILSKSKGNLHIEGKEEGRCGRNNRSKSYWSEEKARPSTLSIKTGMFYTFCKAFNRLFLMLLLWKNLSCSIRKKWNLWLMNIRSCFWKSSNHGW